MKATDIKEMTLEEVKDKVTEESAALGKMKMNHTISQMENPMQIRFKRRGLARLKTELRTRELNNQNKA